MTRKVKTTTVREELPETAVNGLDPLPGLENVTWDTQEDEILDRIKAQYGEAPIKIKVYKITTGKANPVFCFESADNVDESTVQESWGGGKYALRFLVEGIIKHTHYIEVADKPIKPGTSQNPNDIESRMLRENMAFTQNLLLSILGKPNPMQPQTPMAEVVQAYQLIHAQNGNGGGGVSVDKMIDLFSRGMEIGAGKSGEMDWKTMLLQTVKELAAPAMSIIAQSKGVEVTNNNPALQNGVVVPDQVLKEGLAFLKQKIVAGLPVGLALDWVIANAADYQQFISAAMSKSFEDIVRIDNELANEPYNSWLRQFLKMLKEHFTAAATEDESEDQSE